MQLFFETLLYAELADVVGAAVVALVVAVVNGFFFLRVDAADVAHHMTAQLAKRVTAKQARLNVYARKAKALRSKAGDFFIRQARANWQRLKSF